MIGKYIKHERFTDVCFKVTHKMKTSTGYELMGIYRQISNGGFLDGPCIIEIRNQDLQKWLIVDTCEELQKVA